MISETNTQTINGSVYLRIPPHLVEYLKLSKEKSMLMEIRDDVGKYGRFISAWRKDQKKEE